MDAMTPSSDNVPRRLAAGLVSAALLALCLVQSPSARATQAAEEADRTLEDFVRAQVDEGLRVEIEFGELPAGTQLAPCHRIEPFMANGQRLWGRSVIGVRCTDGARWSVALPLTVRVFGEALVASRQLAAREAVTSDDVRLAEVELTRYPSAPLSDLAAIDGQMTTRPIPAGEPLMAHHVRIRPSVAVGDPVRILVAGRGFAVYANGSALAPGSEGQPLRVRSDAGKVLVGTLKGRTVEIRL